VLKLLAAIMFLTAALLLYFALGALSNLWADYRDSPVLTYVGIGGLELIAAAGATLVGLWFLREDERLGG